MSVHIQETHTSEEKQGKKLLSAFLAKKGLEVISTEIYFHCPLFM